MAMKRILLLATLSSGFGSAAVPTWEYATLGEVKSGSEVAAYFLQGEPLVKSGARTRREVATQLKCAVESGDLDISEAALLNCLGKQGWELVTIGSSATGSILTKTFYFKRLAQ